MSRLGIKRQALPPTRARGSVARRLSVLSPRSRTRTLAKRSGFARTSLRARARPPRRVYRWRPRQANSPRGPTHDLEPIWVDRAGFDWPKGARGKHSRVFHWLPSGRSKSFCQKCSFDRLQTDAGEQQLIRRGLTTHPIGPELARDSNKTRREKFQLSVADWNAVRWWTPGSKIKSPSRAPGGPFPPVSALRPPAESPPRDGSSRRAPAAAPRRAGGRHRLCRHAR